MSLAGTPPGVLARAIALFASTYALADVSLELASAGGEKKAWHHVLATAVAGAMHTAAGRQSVPRGVAVGAALGAASLPLWYATVHSSPSLLQLLRRAQAKEAAAVGDAAAAAASAPAPAVAGSEGAAASPQAQGGSATAAAGGQGRLK